MSSEHLNGLDVDVVDCIEILQGVLSPPLPFCLVLVHSG